MISKILIWLVRLYQLTLAPIIGHGCRYKPSCSQYMIDSIREWGPLRGVWMGLRRIGRCHPWGGHGYDPVPKRTGVK